MKTKITIQRDEGLEEIPAHRRGPYLAIRKDSVGWSVTHLPTGFRVSPPSMIWEDANRICRNLRRLHPSKLDFTAADWPVPWWEEILEAMNCTAKPAAVPENAYSGRVNQ